MTALGGAWERLQEPGDEPSILITVRVPGDSSVRIAAAERRNPGLTHSMLLRELIRLGLEQFETGPPATS